jgi:hypothetical protein
MSTRSRTCVCSRPHLRRWTLQRPTLRRRGMLVSLSSRGARSLLSIVAHSVSLPPVPFSCLAQLSACWSYAPGVQDGRHQHARPTWRARRLHGARAPLGAAGARVAWRRSHGARGRARAAAAANGRRGRDRDCRRCSRSGMRVCVSLVVGGQDSVWDLACIVCRATYMHAFVTVACNVRADFVFNIALALHWLSLRVRRTMLCFA